MIKIEVTGNSIAEVSDKLLAIGASLQRTVSHDADNAAREALQAKRDAAKKEVAEAAPKVAEEAPVEYPMSVYLEVAEEAPVDPTPAPKSAPAAEATESQPTTEEPSTTPAPSASASELNFDTDVAPIVLQVVKDKGKPAVQAILEQFGVERASQLDPARWPELVVALKDIL
jgi:hypothetical protein